MLLELFKKKETILLGFECLFNKIEILLKSSNVYGMSLFAESMHKNMINDLIEIGKEHSFFLGKASYWLNETIYSINHTISNTLPNKDITLNIISHLSAFITLHLNHVFSGNTILVTLPMSQV